MFVDADFAGGFDENNAKYTASVCSKTGCATKHAGCPILWKSKLQTDIAFSTAEAEYIPLSMALRETIHMLHLLR